MNVKERKSVLGVLLTAALAAVGVCGCGTETPPPPISVSLSPTSVTVQPGQTTQFTASLLNDSANRGVTWTVTCSTAPCGTVFPAATGGGVPTTYTAPVAPPAGGMMVTITATSVADNSKSASGSITVNSPVMVSVVATVGLVQVGSTSQITATVTGDPANKGVTWTLSCSAASCGAVSPTATASGVATTYTASIPQPLDSILVTITATSVSDPSVSGAITITIPGVMVTITPAAARVEAGSTAQFTATVTNDTANQGVTWTLALNGTACSPTCGTISATSSASGTPITYTAPSVPPANNILVTLTATSVSNTSAAISAGVTVPAITVSVTPVGALIPVNITQQFLATVSNDPGNQGATWTLTQSGTACSPACGAISASSSASGTPIIYTAPATVPTSPSVTLTAASAADTTKSANATITISTGTIQIAPNILSFGTKRVNSGSTPAQTVTLTNTGNSALSITNIAITGATADYSQSNTCATSIGPGSNCTFSVTFHPTATGLRSADISIADSSTDSPQQVSLTGTGTTRGPLNAVAMLSTLAQEGTAAAPLPEGPDKVGTRIVDLVDSTRYEPYLSNGSKRELVVRFWYPASLNQECQPAQYTSPKVWNYFSTLAGVPLPKVTTNSCMNAPVAEGLHAVVVFTHGFTGTFTDYTFLFEDLASRGYVVASVNHTHEATASEFPDGRFAKSVLGSHLADSWRGDDQALTFATSVRLDDLRFVVNELQRLNMQADSPFASRLDMSRVAVAGHSLGGAAAFLSVEEEPRFRAGIIIDGFVPGALIRTTRTPVLILAAGREKWSSDECRLWGNLRGPRLAVNLEGAEHETPSDAVWLLKGAIRTGEMGPDKTIAAVRNYVAAFLDANLAGRPMDPGLTTPSSKYPDIAVITQDQSVCRQP